MLDPTLPGQLFPDFRHGFVHQVAHHVFPVPAQTRVRHRWVLLHPWLPVPLPGWIQRVIALPARISSALTGTNGTGATDASASLKRNPEAAVVSR